MEQQPPSPTIISSLQDGFWKLNLTSNFIALSTLRCTRWEDFALKLDKAVAAFLQIYHADYFEAGGPALRQPISRSAWA